MRFSGLLIYAFLTSAVFGFLAVLIFSTTQFKPGWSGCGERRNCTEIYQTSAKSDYSRMVLVRSRPGFVAREGWD